MQRIGTDPEIQAMVERTRERARIAAEAHEARLASLPPGTCPNCYGDGCMRCTTFSAVRTADGVPYEFQGVTLASYGAREGQLTAVRASTDLVRDLYLYGGVGAGKTRLAAAIANTWVGQRRSAYFARVPMLLYQLQPGRDQDDSAALERRLLTASLVVFDDIGAERDAATDYTRRTLLMLYEGRSDAGLRSVFTSNKSLAELSQQQDDDRLSSRLAGRCVVVHMKTPDQRLRRVK